MGSKAIDEAPLRTRRLWAGACFATLAGCTVDGWVYDGLTRAAVTAMDAATDAGEDVVDDAGDAQVGRWSPWYMDMRGQVVSGPGAVCFGPGRLDVFALGLDDDVWHFAVVDRYMTWDRTFLGMRSMRRVNPAAASWGPERLDVFPISAAGAVLHQSWQAGGLHPYESLSAPPGGLAPGTGVAATAWGRERLDVFAAGASGRVYHLPYDGPRGVPWRRWIALPEGPTRDTPAAASRQEGWVDVIARGEDGALWTTRYDAAHPEAGWTNHEGGDGWASLGVQVVSSPAVASWGEGRLDVFVRTTERPDRLAQITFRDGRWRAPEYPLPADGGDGVPAVASWGVGHLDVLVAVGDRLRWTRFE